MRVLAFFQSFLQGIRNIPGEFLHFARNGMNYKGRERRGPFLRFYLTIVILLSMFNSLILSGHGAIFWQMFMPVFLVFALFSVTSAMSRRMRDAGFTPWLLLLPVSVLPIGILYGWLFPPNEYFNMGFIIYSLLAVSGCTLLLLFPSKERTR